MTSLGPCLLSPGAVKGQRSVSIPGDGSYVPAVILKTPDPELRSPGVKSTWEGGCAFENSERDSRTHGAQLDSRGRVPSVVTVIRLVARPRVLSLSLSCFLGAGFSFQKLLTCQQPGPLPQSCLIHAGLGASGATPRPEPALGGGLGWGKDKTLQALSDRRTAMRKQLEYNGQEERTL